MTESLSSILQDGELVIIEFINFILGRGVSTKFSLSTMDLLLDFLPQY